MASIIGSGYLVLGPILKFEFGSLCILIMIGLSIAAYMLGEAIRFNFKNYDLNEHQAGKAPKWRSRIEKVASYSLALAYIVSITYNLNLFGSRAESLTSVDDQLPVRLIDKLDHLNINACVLNDFQIKLIEKYCALEATRDKILFEKRAQ